MASPMLTEGGVECRVRAHGTDRAGCRGRGRFRGVGGGGGGGGGRPTLFGKDLPLLNVKLIS